MTAPFFSYDIYYYATTDGVAFRYATIKSCNYTGSTTRGTVVGTGNWGTPVRGDLSTLTEGVNYLRVSSSDPSIAISGVAIDSGSSKRRGSFGAVQIVNTANSQSLTTAENSLVLANATWNNDLTGATGESFNASADGYRIIYTGTEETFTVDLSGATTSLPNIKLIGSATNLVFTGTISQLGQTDAVTDMTSYSSLELPGIGKIAPRGVVKFAPGVTVTSVMEQASIPGAYLVDGSTVSLAKISGGQIVAIEPTTASTPTDGMDLKVTSVVTDNAIRTLNSLTSTHDYKNNKALTITSGMMMFNNRNHWVQGGGTITSGYRNADGEYDLYLCALGTADDMRIDSSTIIDNPGGKLNLIKTGSGAASISRAKSANTYSGKTIVLEGHLQIAENVRSTEFYVARGAELDFSSQNYRGGDLGDYNFTATSLSGDGVVEIGNGNNKITMTLNNVANDGSKFSKVNAIGKSLTMNDSTIHANLVNSKTVITLNSSSIVADTFNSIGDTTVKFDATSTLNAAAIATSAGALTMEIPSGRTLEISSVITGAGGLVKDGAGKMTLKAKNTFAGGTLKINNFGYNEAGNSSLGGLTYSSNGSTNIHFNGGTIQIAESFGETINRKIELQENGGTLDLAEGVSLVLGANIHGDGGLTKAGAGTMELTYANGYTGGTAVSGGYLKLTDAAVRDNGSMTVASGATLEYAVGETPTTPLLAFDTNKKFASSGTVLKTGAGALKINATAEDCFEATTLTVVEGRLDMKSYLTGRLEINNGAVFSPGNSVGKLNVTGSVALGQTGVSGDAAQVIMELGGSSRGQNDELVVTGDLELNNAQIILEMAEGSGLYPGESFTAVFSSGNSGSYASNFINTYVQAPYYLIDLAYTEISPGTYAITGRLDGNALPEPATWFLLLLGTAGLLYWRKK